VKSTLHRPYVSNSIFVTNPICYIDFIVRYQVTKQVNHQIFLTMLIPGAKTKIYDFLKYVIYNLLLN